MIDPASWTYVTSLTARDALGQLRCPCCRARAGAECDQAPSFYHVHRARWDRLWAWLASGCVVCGRYPGIRGRRELTSDHGFVTLRLTSVPPVPNAPGWTLRWCRHVAPDMHPHVVCVGDCELRVSLSRGCLGTAAGQGVQALARLAGAPAGGAP